MNMNSLGKLLVLLHVALSVVALAWATGLYLQFLDYGWLEPRADLDKRVASEFDKRVVALQHARAAVDRAMRDVNPRVDRLYDARESFAQNELVFMAELERLRTETAKDGKDLTFLTPTVKGGRLVLKDKDYSAPMLTDKLKGIVKSYKGYRDERTDLETKILGELKEHQKLTEEHAVISRVLNGKLVDGKKAEPGVYDLLEEEQVGQRHAKDELFYLEKVWAPVLQESEVFVERRARLERTLRDLEKSLEKGKSE
jgi:hypothetical protein